MQAGDNGTSLKHWKEKKTQKTVNLKFYGQQQYPLNNEREIKTSSDKENKSWENLSPADLHYKK